MNRGNGSGSGYQSNRFLPLLLILVACSGFAALIYEIVWLQLLQLVIGSSAVSLALLLAAYMGGLCLGSLFLSRIVSLRQSPLRIYAFLEAGTAVFAIIALIGIPIVARVYQVIELPGLGGLVLRGAIAAVCLLPPTILMGASFPAVSRLLETSPSGISSLGLLYGANLFGAVAGGLVAGFYLLRLFDMSIATFVAAGINVAMALISLLLATRIRHSGADTPPSPGPLHRDWQVILIYLAIALSGLGALGAEVVWTRLLSLLLGGTVYTFSIILAVFLAGLWAGSAAGASLARKARDARLVLSACQLLLAAAIAWTAFAISSSLPYWPVDPWLSLNPSFNFQLDVARCVWAILPATLLWGASFPLALAAAGGPGQDPAQLSGEVYAANTAGSIVGALLFSLVLIPAVGTRTSEQLLIAISLAGAIAACASAADLSRRLRSWRAIAVVTAFTAVAIALIPAVGEVPWQVIAYGRRIAPIMRAVDLYKDYPTKVLFRGEGINSSVLIAERAGQRHFYVSGKAEASTAPLDMRLERMMGHLPALIHPQPQSVLVVGFGAGITAGSFTTYPDIHRIVICELEPFIPPASTAFFGKQNYNVLHDSRTQMIYDDARHYIFTTRDKFDVITTDPIHPWIKGTSTLYSKEYYALVKEHLNPGGVVAQWLPIYDSDAGTIKTELATFFSVFPEGTIWSNNLKGDGYDLVLLGRKDSRPVSVDAMQQRLDRPEYAQVGASLSDVGFHAAVEFLATYAGRAADLTPVTAGAAINTDMNMRLQYMAGLGLNSMTYANIYGNLLRYRRFPEGLLVGTGGRIDALRTLIGSPSVNSPIGY